MQLPEGFTQRMKQMLGDEYERFLESYDGEWQGALRANTLKISAEDLAEKADFLAERVPWTGDGYYYGGRPGKHPWHEAGLYYMQEASAMAPAALSGAHPGERILDLCAAPGGKTAQLAALLKGKGLLVSNEIHPERARILSQNVERMGVRNCIVLNEKPETLLERFPSFFDRIIVDAPCSGEGMFRKEEQALTMWSTENIQQCAARQKKILQAAAGMLRSGGTLVYSTCTFAPEENEENIVWFLEQYPEFAAVDLPALLKEDMERFGFVSGNPSWCGRGETDGPCGSPAAAGKTIRLFPHRVKGEGHFLAVLQKGGYGAGAPASLGTGNPAGIMIQAETDAGRRKKKKGGDSARNGKAPAGTAQELFREFAEDALRTDIAAECGADAGSVFLSFGDELYLEPMGIPLPGLKVLRAGLHLGTVKKERFEPSHALALALGREDAARVFDMKADSGEAAAFLRGESIPCDPKEKGWTLMLVDGHSIGWAKASGGMLKNHYPKGLRKVL